MKENVALQYGHLFENLLLSRMQEKQKRCLQLSLPIYPSATSFRSLRQIEHVILPCCSSIL